MRTTKSGGEQLREQRAKTTVVDSAPGNSRPEPLRSTACCQALSRFPQGELSTPCRLFIRRLSQLSVGISPRAHGTGIATRDVPSLFEAPFVTTVKIDVKWEYCF